MNFKTPLLLLALVCILGIIAAGIYYFSPDAETTYKPGDMIFHADAEKVDYFLINSTNIQVECKKNRDGWFFLRPFTTAADNGKINQLIGAFLNSKYVDVITESQQENRELTPVDFGLGSNAADVVVGIGTNRYEFLLGTKVPAGDMCYARFNGGGNVFVLDTKFYALLPEKVDGLRAHNIMPGSSLRVRKIMFQKDGSFIELEKDRNNNWNIRQPRFYSADNGIVTAILDKLFNAQIKDFVWDKKVAWDTGKELPDDVGDGLKARCTSCGVSDGAAKVMVTVWVAGDNEGTELLLGKYTDEKQDTVYARLKGHDTIFTCDAALLNLLDVSVNKLRNRSLIQVPHSKINQLCFKYKEEQLILHKNKKTGWNITSPVQWKADDDVVNTIIQLLLSIRIDEFLKADTEQYVVPNADNSIKICVSELPDECDVTNKETVIQPENTDVIKQSIFILGKNDGNKMSDVIARYAEETNTILRLNTIGNNELVNNLTKPLFFKSRQIISLDKDNITRITVKKGDNVIAVFRDQDGKWHANNDDVQDVDTAVIEDILLCAANMRAEKIEPEKTKASACGLDNPSAIITFGMLGKEGLNKTILLGKKTDSGEVYAKIQGDDIIFVISAKMAETLTRDIY